MHSICIRRNVEPPCYCNKTLYSGYGFAIGKYNLLTITVISWFHGFVKGASQCAKVPHNYDVVVLTLLDHTIIPQRLPDSGQDRVVYRQTTATATHQVLLSPAGVVLAHQPRDFELDMC
jgi:hypothetical protein